MFELTTIPLMLAEVVPAPDFFTSVYGILLQNGLMGLALAFLIYIYLKRDKELQASWQQRLEDARILATIIKDHATSLAINNKAQDERNNLLDTMSRISEKSTIIIEQLSKQINDLQQNMKK